MLISCYTCIKQKSHKVILCKHVFYSQVREFIKPKKVTKDYAEFFAQNALPNNYPGYRAPPGTQHHITEDDELEE